MACYANALVVCCPLLLQVLILNAVKDVASALSGLLGATKNASGKPASAPEMEQLRSSAKVKPLSNGIAFCIDPRVFLSNESP